MYDRLSVREEIGFTVLFLLKRKNKRLPQIIFLSLALIFLSLYVSFALLKETILYTYENIIHFNERHNIVGLDVVELCPNDINKAPDFLASKLIYQILSIRFKQ